MRINGMISVVIPARNEPFLNKTILDILENAKGKIEILVVLDGVWPEEQNREYWYTPAIIEDPRVTYIHRGSPRGMRDGINSAVNVAKGEFILKSDAHCMFDEGFDVKLVADVPEYSRRLDAFVPKNYTGENVAEENEYPFSDNWIVIPRRKRLDAEKWAIQEVGKPDVDYEYLSSPRDKGAKGMIWTERIIERLGKPEYDIDENLSFQGSCWFMTKNHYVNRLGGMNDKGYGTFVRESQELGLKTWLGGGKVMTNKKTWYAHLHKGKTYGRGYFLDKHAMIKGEQYCDDMWFNNKWKDAKHDLAWLIERFMPVPGWDQKLIDQVKAK